MAPGAGSSAGADGCGSSPGLSRGKGWELPQAQIPQFHAPLDFGQPGCLFPGLLAAGVEQKGLIPNIPAQKKVRKTQKKKKRNEKEMRKKKKEGKEVKRKRRKNKSKSKRKKVKRRKNNLKKENKEKEKSKRKKKGN